MFNVKIFFIVKIYFVVEEFSSIIKFFLVYNFLKKFLVSYMIMWLLVGFYFFYMLNMIWYSNENKKCCYKMVYSYVNKLIYKDNIL